MMNCRIYGNWSPQIDAESASDGLVSITNCFVAGDIDGKGAFTARNKLDPDGGVGIQTARGRIDHCTIVNCSQGIVVSDKVSIGNSIIVNCAKALIEVRSTAVNFFTMRNTILYGGDFVFGDKKVSQSGWAEFVKPAKWAIDNLWANPQLLPPFFSLPSDSPYKTFGQYGRTSGAVLPPFARWNPDQKEVYIRPAP
ncbi:MAG: hypothetical protein HQL31_04885 [Planctomycetes bacterium]|nr:hypothetical protein [Planctomycetota bacterium]